MQNFWNRLTPIEQRIITQGISLLWVALACIGHMIFLGNLFLFLTWVLFPLALVGAFAEANVETAHREQDLPWYVHVMPWITICILAGAGWFATGAIWGILYGTMYLKTVLGKKEVEDQERDVSTEDVE